MEPEELLKPVKASKERKITPKEAEQAAEEAGISVIRIKRLKGGAKVGEFIEQLGATKVGRSTLIVAQERVEDSLQQCDDTLDRMKEEGMMDFELISEILKIKLGFTSELTKIGSAMVKSPDYMPGVNQSGPTQRAFPPNVIIGLNVSDEKKIEIKPIEQISLNHEEN